MEFENFIQSKEFFDYSHSDTPQLLLPKINEEEVKKRLVPSTSDYLVTFSTKSQSYCVGYVDIVNSTKISASLSAEKLIQYYEIFLNSMSKIIGRFGGRVIKNIGDCLLFYFPNSVNSTELGLMNCLNCGLAMTHAYKIISAEIKSKKLPDLNYRVSADFGKVILMNTSNSQSIDLIGPPVNMCAKINHFAKNNEFVIGSDLHQYAKKFVEYKCNEIQSYDVGFRYSYPVYGVTSSYR